MFANQTLVTFFAFVFGCLATTCIAQQDADGSSDHPLLTRYPAFNLIDYSAVEFDKAQIIVGPGFVDTDGVMKLDLQSVEGAVTNIKYCYEGADVISGYFG